MTIKEAKGEKVKDSDDVAKIFYSILQAGEELDKGKEHFWTMILDSQNVITEIHLIGLGALDGVYTKPREIFRPAVIGNALNIILSHNHPSGNVKPSTEDITETVRYRNAGEILGIKVLDHIIIGNRADNEHYSFADRGLMGRIK